MLALKDGATIEGIKPEILLGVMILESIFTKYTYDLILTEATGGEHMQGSFHYQGLAVDIRSKHLPPDIKMSILSAGKKRLTNLFDFILEGVGTANEHFHLEYDYRGN